MSCPSLGGFVACSNPNPPQFQSGIGQSMQSPSGVLMAETHMASAPHSLVNGFEEMIPLN